MSRECVNAREGMSRMHVEEDTRPSKRNVHESFSVQGIEL